MDLASAGPRCGTIKLWVMPRNLSRTRRQGPATFTAHPPEADEISIDIIEGGGPPRRPLPRSLVVGFYVVCGLAALGWVGVTVLDRVDDLVATRTAEPDCSWQSRTVVPTGPWRIRRHAEKLLRQPHRH